MSSIWKHHKIVKDWKSVPKEFFKKWQSFFVMFEGMYDGSYYKNDFNVSDLKFVFKDEITDRIDETTEIFTLNEPLCVMYVTDKSSGKKSPVSGQLTVEFQLVINTKPQVILNLNGYTALIKALCDPEKGKAYWMSFGLVPRKVEETNTINGGELSDKFQDRFFIRSIIVNFDILGDYSG